jgi:hypothetical protein
MSDGRFAVLGDSSNGGPVESCEALVVDGDAHWEPLPPMQSLFSDQRRVRGRRRVRHRRRRGMS